MVKIESPTFKEAQVELNKKNTREPQSTFLLATSISIENAQLLQSTRHDYKGSVMSEAVLIASICQEIYEKAQRDLLVEELHQKLKQIVFSRR